MMNKLRTDCKKVFKEAYEKRYTWPESFSGYKGKCLYLEDDKNFEGDFCLDSSFKPIVNNIHNEDIKKNISSQLFEVAIHRVRRDFNSIHSKNDFKFLGESQLGINMQVIGKNEGDKYIVKNNKINMVFRNIHGFIVEIFVQEFLDTGLGFLSTKYTSQQIDKDNLKPLSGKFKYHDNFINLEGNDLWVLESRKIEFLDKNKNMKCCQYLFKDLTQIK